MERAATVDEAAVIAYLRAHPAFLAANPALYGALEPPRRVHGAVLADHMAAMLAAERGRAEGVLAAGRAAAGLAARVQEAVLALLRADDVAECIAAEMPALLAVDAATLCLEGELAGARRLPAGSVARLLGGRGAVLRGPASPDQLAPARAVSGEEAQLLHGEAARLAQHEALVLVPGEGAPALLALVARAPGLLDASQGTGALVFLGRAVAAALGR